MAITQIDELDMNKFYTNNVQAQKLFDKLQKTHIGFINMCVTDNDVIMAGSSWECNNRFYETNSNITLGSSGEVIYFNPDTNSFVRNNTKPAWNTAKKCFYSGNSRALMYKYSDCKKWRYEVQRVIN